MVETGRRGTCGPAESMGPGETVYKVVVPACGEVSVQL